MPVVRRVGSCPTGGDLLSQLAQLEPVIETFVNRSEQALGAVQHGVEVIGSQLGLVERRRRRRGWLRLIGFLAVGAVVFVAAKRLRADDDEAAA
jgi:hypothetical protein